LVRALTLSRRVVHAPMTRLHAEPDLGPGGMMVEFDSAPPRSLVITEGAHSSFNRRGYSWPTRAGIGASGSHRELPRVKISDLTAQGRLGCVQPPFRRHREAAFLGDRAETAKMV
jgi:hypothetical protein